MSVQELCQLYDDVGHVLEAKWAAYMEEDDDDPETRIKSQISYTIANMDGWRCTLERNSCVCCEISIAQAPISAIDTPTPSLA